MLNASTLDLSAANSVPVIYQGTRTLGFGAWLQTGALACMNPCMRGSDVHLVDTAASGKQKQARQLLEG
ncbi:MULTISPECIES: hypothetical protein [Comamonas]|uniref:hypothetical protein n=1 Tax=Comamonas TaxID=283 RepID=UPI0011C02DDC|nr:MULTISPECIES: hypothetical protein [Comamonas]